MREGTLGFVLIFPAPWPPAKELLLFKKIDGGSQVLLISDVAGRLSLLISCENSAIQSYTFQPTRLEGKGRAIVFVWWSDGTAGMSINGVELMLDADAEGKHYVVKTSEDPLPTGSVFPGLNPNNVTSEAERLFLSTIVDIDQKLAEGSRYSLIRAAGLLRQLFLDSVPLVHVVNRCYGLKLQFECIDYCTELPVSPEISWQNLDPSLFPNADTTAVDLKAFLKAPCLEIEGHMASVADLIKACAHVKGGVHFGKAASPEEQSLIDFDKAIEAFGEEPSLRAIAGVCRIALTGLRPLVMAIITAAS